MSIISTFHGMCNSLEYNSWRGMKERCNNPNNTGYKGYGARGIKVCKRWNDFNCFFEDMGCKPTPKHSIDRIDNDGDYCPENCRWATCQEQNENSRHNVFHTIDGITKTQKQWCIQYGVHQATFISRIRLGWSLIDALTKPAKRGNNQFTIPT